MACLSGSSFVHVERFFCDFFRYAICDGSFDSISELVRSIDAYIAAHNLESKLYQYEADGAEIAEIIAKIQQAREKLNESSYCKLNESAYEGVPRLRTKNQAGSTEIKGCG